MSTPPHWRIVIADDHEAVRRGVRQLVERSDRSIVGEAADGEEALHVVLEEKPDLLILDYAIPVMNGLQVCKRVVAGSPSTEILFYTMHDREQTQIEILRAGARGYVLKSDPAETLLAAVETLLRHKPYFSPTLSHSLLESFLKNADRPKSTITDREFEVLQLIAEGLTNRLIAENLGISIKTVETHRSALMTKLQSRSTADLVRYAIRNGIIEA